MARRRNQDVAISLFAFQDIITGVAGVMLFILLLLVVQLAIKTAEATTPPVPEPTPSPASTIEFASPQAVADLESLRLEVRRLQTQNEKLFNSDRETLDEDLATLKQKIKERERAAEELLRATAAMQREKEELASSPETEKTFESIASLRKQIKEIEEKMTTLEDGNQVSFTISGDVREDAWMVDMDRDSIRIFAAKGAPKGAEIQRGMLSSPASAAQKIRAKLKELTTSRTLVVLIRPSDPEGSYETIMRLRKMGYNVAMELLGSGVDVIPLRQ